MKPPPPIPQENGSVTPRTAAAATAASTALPPSSRMRIAALVASSSTVAAAPPVPVAVGGAVETAALLAVAASATRTPSARSRRIARTLSRTREDRLEVRQDVLEVLAADEARRHHAASVLDRRACVVERDLGARECRSDTSARAVVTVAARTVLGEELITA